MTAGISALRLSLSSPSLFKPGSFWGAGLFPLIKLSLMARTKSINFPNTETELSALLDKLQRPLSCILLNSGGLAIGSGSTAKIKIANTIYAYFESVLAKKTTAEITLTTANNVTNAKFNVIVLTMTSDGTVTPRNGTEASTIGGVIFPTVPDGSVVVGFVIINPTGTGGFVGGTTALSDGTVVPNAVYIDTPLAFLPGMEAI